MTFGEKLKALRVKEEYSQEQLAALLHVSRQAVTKWENDAGMPDIENIKAVADLFDYALADEGPQEPDAADMSVDDILNLRAGEPTALFNARNVASRVDALHKAERQSFAPVRAGEAEYEVLPSVSLGSSRMVGMCALGAGLIGWALYYIALQLRKTSKR